MKAIILAGGNEPSKIGALHRTSLLPIPTDKGTIPVINSNADKLLEIPEVEQIIILVKKKHLERYKQWKEIYYADNRKVVIECDEEFLPKKSSPGHQDAQGPLWALSKVISGLQIDRSRKPVIVVPGHNYFEDSLKELAAAFKTNKLTTIAYRNLKFPELVRDDMQVVRLKGNTVTSLIDSPAKRTDSDTNALITCYILNADSIKQLQNYVKHNPHQIDRTYKFLQWLIDKTTVCGCEFTNRWWDFGAEGDYGNLLWIINRNRFLIQTVDDLIRAKEADALTDACFLLGRNFVIDPALRSMTIDFEDKDLVCGDSGYVGSTMEKAAVRDRTSKKENNNLRKLESALRNFKGRSVAINFREGTGVFFSGGVFLFDTPVGNINDIRPDSLHIPLLERDYTAKADPGRLTTPAGRLDDTNLRALCYSELLEEMVFYGFHGSSNVSLFTVFPYDSLSGYKVREKLVKRLLSKNIRIPGIDFDQLREEGRNPGENLKRLVNIIPPFEPQLQNAPAFQDLPFWNVNIKIKGRNSPRPVPSVYVIFDRRNSTIEFRLVAFANISELSAHPPQIYSVHSFGRLIGIADGDGYRRRTFLISAKEFADYYRNVVNASKQQRLDDYLLLSGMHSVEIARMGDGTNAGRFSASGIKVPALSLTTSLSKMAELTSKLT